MQVDHCHKSSTSSSDCSSSSTVCPVPVTPAAVTEVFDHVFTVYVADCYGIEIDGTEFKVSATIVKEPLTMKSGCNNYQLYKVTLQLPAINFETGPYANNVYETNNPVSEPIDEVVGLFLPPPQNGGYLYTKAGYLPKELRPNELMTRAYFGPCNNGQNIPFHYIQNPNPPPITNGVVFTAPINGYILRITNTGAIALEGTGALGTLFLPVPSKCYLLLLLILLNPIYAYLITLELALALLMWYNILILLLPQAMLIMYVITILMMLMIT